jgi:hypothetical protein
VSDAALHVIPELCWQVRDIWNRTDLGRFNGSFHAAAVLQKTALMKRFYIVLTLLSLLLGRPWG